MTEIKIPKKLIEVALPLDDINEASTRENYIYKGNPSAIHKWWAQRPLAAARAIIFAQMVNDPGFESGDGFKRGLKRADAEVKREELFNIIRDLVRWENNNNPEVLDRAYNAILESWRETCEMNKNHPDAPRIFNPEKLPAFYDPFAGGGTIPLEAKRLGLQANASDLNPIPIMINNSLISVPSAFHNTAPVSPQVLRSEQGNFSLDENGLSIDVLAYGDDLINKAKRKIGEQFANIKITEELANDHPHLKNYVGHELKILAFFWARTVASPSPAYSDIHVPLIRTFLLSSKKGKEVYLEPIINKDSYSFKVIAGKPKNLDEVKSGTKVARGANFKCLLSGVPISSVHVKAEASQGRMGTKLVAIAVEGPKGRTYISPIDGLERVAKEAKPGWRPDLPLSGTSQYLGVLPYGMENFADLFTSRQTVVLETLTSLIGETFEKVKADALQAGLPNDHLSLNSGGKGALAYAQAIAMYLAFAIDKYAIYGNTLVTWYSKENRPSMLFSQNALPMTWDFVEMNPFAEIGGGLKQSISIVSNVVKNLPITGAAGRIEQKSATIKFDIENVIISTDPPYYDNVPYADLSDFFYVLLRRSLKEIIPDVFKTISTPKSDELVAFAYRHKDSDAAEFFFMDGMTTAMKNIAASAHPAFPVTIYYAFKQSETINESTGSKGWETFLDAVLNAGFAITGTWPIRTERQGRTRSNQSNALASSIVLVCEKRSKQCNMISRREFQRELRDTLPIALETMLGGETGQSPIAPVDLAQSAIGPGMAVFSNYAAVLNQDGSKMSVHDALILINREITTYLSPNSGSFDSDTLFCSAWFDQYGWSSGQFGEAQVLAQAKGTTVDGAKEAGVIESGGGKVRLLKWKEYPFDWDPQKDNRTPVWEACHHMIHKLNNQSEIEAGALLARMPEKGEAIRQLAYHLYTLCERKKWAEDARAYNELMTAWPNIVTASYDAGHKGQQAELELRSGT